MLRKRILSLFLVFIVLLNIFISPFKYSNINALENDIIETIEEKDKTEETKSLNSNKEKTTQKKGIKLKEKAESFLQEDSLDIDVKNEKTTIENNESGVDEKVNLDNSNDLKEDVKNNQNNSSTTGKELEKVEDTKDDKDIDTNNNNETDTVEDNNKENKEVENSENNSKKDNKDKLHEELYTTFLLRVNTTGIHASMAEYLTVDKEDLLPGQNSWDNFYSYKIVHNVPLTEYYTGTPNSRRDGSLATGGSVSGSHGQLTKNFLRFSNGEEIDSFCVEPGVIFKAAQYKASGGNPSTSWYDRSKDLTFNVSNYEKRTWKKNNVFQKETNNKVAAILDAHESSSQSNREFAGAQIAIWLVLMQAPYRTDGNYSNYIVQDDSLERNRETPPEVIQKYMEIAENNKVDYGNLDFYYSEGIGARDFENGGYTEAFEGSQNVIPTRPPSPNEVPTEIRITIEKADEDNLKKKLHGAVYTIKKAVNSQQLYFKEIKEGDYELLPEGEKGLTEVTTDKYGLIRLRKMDRNTKISVREVKAPEGYILDSKTYYMDPINMTYRMFTNKKSDGVLNIEKLDSYSNKGIKDVEFSIYNNTDSNYLSFKEVSKGTTNVYTYSKENTGLYNVKTGSEGKLKIDNLPLDKNLTLYETKTSNINELSTEQHSLIFTEDKLTINKEIYNKRKAVKGMINHDVSLRKLGSTEENKDFFDKPLENVAFDINIQIEDLETNSIVLNKKLTDKKTNNLGMLKIPYTIIDAKQGFQYKVNLEVVEINNPFSEYKETKGSSNISYIIKDSLLEDKTENAVSSIVLDKSSIVIDNKIENAEVIINKENTTNNLVLDVHNFKNKGGIQINKTEKGDKNIKLPGVEFSLYDSDKKFISKSITNYSGIARFVNLSSGDYYIKETRSLRGYIAKDEYIPVKVTENKDNTFSVIDVENDFTELTIIKQDRDTKEKLDNVTFLLKGPSYPTGKKITTDSEGKIKLEKLILGDYTLEELETKEGYILNSTPFEIELSKENHKIELTINNTTNKLKLKKKDNENKLLEGVVFGVFEGKITNINDVRKGSIEPIETIVTNAEGIASMDKLAYGDYSIIELETIKGYILSDEIKYITEKDMLDKLSDYNTTYDLGTFINYKIPQGDIIDTGGKSTQLTLILISFLFVLYTIINKRNLKF